jgi:TRAP-type C4-dicarboxylate transport system substrate-binding protein
MGKKKFDGMPKEDQDLFLKTALEVAKFQRKINRDAEENSMKEMASKGVTVVRDVDRESFKKAMAPVFDQFSNQFPKAEIETIMNAK